jgi:hypothetical protein
VCLDHKGVGTADAFLEAYVDLAVGEVVGAGGKQIDLELFGDLFGEFRVCPA